MAKKDRNDIEHRDIQVRIQKLKQQAIDLTDGQMVSDRSSDCPPEVEEQFWKNVVAFEQADWSQPFQSLIESGLSLPPPDELDDSQLTAKLWEVINGLALLRVYLSRTNHLSDCQLYTQLWTDSLREEMVLLPGDSTYACHIDMIGSGSEEDNYMHLKYYADEEERGRWAKEWPEDMMPDHEEPRFDRDRHLPQASYGDENDVN